MLLAQSANNKPFVHHPLLHLMSNYHDTDYHRQGTTSSAEVDVKEPQVWLPESNGRLQHSALQHLTCRFGTLQWSF